MWKAGHRRAAERRGLRYPSDLTDAKWVLVEPMIPPAERGGRKRTVDVREVLNGIFYVLSTGSSGTPCRPPRRQTCRRSARSTTHWIGGTGPAHWSGSMRRSTSPCASRQGEKPARRWRSSMPRAPRGRKKGGVARSVGLRRGQEGHGPQAA